MRAPPHRSSCFFVISRCSRGVDLTSMDAQSAGCSTRAAIRQQECQGSKEAAIIDGVDWFGAPQAGNSGALVSEDVPLDSGEGRTCFAADVDPHGLGGGNVTACEVYKTLKPLDDMLTRISPSMRWSGFSFLAGAAHVGGSAEAAPQAQAAGGAQLGSGRCLCGSW